MEAGKSYAIERCSAYTRLSLDANLNAFHWTDIERSATEILAALESARAKMVLVDLTQLDYLGSAQLALLVRVWKAVKGRDGKMVVELTGPVVREVLKTAGLQSLWEVTESRTESFRALGLQEDGRPRMSWFGPALGITALAAAVAGLVITVRRIELINDQALLIAQLSCSAVALAAGLWTVIFGTGGRRGLGAGLIVASACLAVVEVFNRPR